MDNYLKFCYDIAKGGNETIEQAKVRISALHDLYVLFEASRSTVRTQYLFQINKYLSDNNDKINQFSRDIEAFKTIMCDSCLDCKISMFEQFIAPKYNIQYIF